jgi:hypothetical protein
VAATVVTVFRMSKYYGKSADQQRGEYSSRQLAATFSRDEFAELWGLDPGWGSPALDLRHHLRRTGLCLAMQSHSDASHLCGVDVYHLAGATVAVEYDFAFPAQQALRNAGDGDIYGRVAIRLASNDSFDDVVQRLRKKFPYLREIADE